VPRNASSCARAGTEAAAAILDICRRVEGLPRSSSPHVTRAREASRMSCAKDELRTRRVASRARRARGGFDQSKHLGTVEREVLARLSVFRGGFAPDAARGLRSAVAGARGVADKSLVRKDGARLHLHPLVQQPLLSVRRRRSGRRARPMPSTTCAWSRASGHDRRRRPRRAPAVEAESRTCALRGISPWRPACDLAARCAAAAQLLRPARSAEDGPP
jgi:hypothetical protein